MKCSTPSASEIGKQATSLQQLDKKNIKVTTQSEKSRIGKTIGQLIKVRTPRRL